MNTPDSQNLLNKISTGLICFGFLAGLFVGYGVLSGDAQGRVNLLYSLMLFAFLPVVALLLNLLMWIGNSSKGLVSSLLELPILPSRIASALMAFASTGSRKIWIFYQAQWFALSFASGSLLVYLLLLLGSDISFVWRSTLLEAPDLLPVLNLMASPWIFWPDAQPSLKLLMRSQDFRLDTLASYSLFPGQWWKFILAAQCTYNLIPRLLMLAFARNRYHRSLQESIKGDDKTKNAGASFRSNPDTVSPSLVPVVYAIDADYILLNWAIAPPFCLQSIEKKLGESRKTLEIDLLNDSAETHATLASETVVVLVKSWEPPLAELGDYLLDIPLANTNSLRYLLPLDWTERQLVSIRSDHLDEWRRFCGTLAGWQLLQLERSE